MNTTQFYTDTPPNIPIELIGDVVYVMAPFGGNARPGPRGIYFPGPAQLSNLIGGFDLYTSYEDYTNGQTNSFIITTSSGYSPTSQSSSSSLSFGLYIGYPPGVFVEYPLASAYGLDADNYTWDFYYSVAPIYL